MKNDFAQIARDILKSIWGSLSHNIWYKLLSIVIAVILWSYVITSNPSITRPKLLDVDIRVTGTTALESKNLALVTDTTSDLPHVQVRVDVPQQSYQFVTTQNVNADLDLSQIKTTGKQMVKLKSTSTLGNVVSTSPEMIEIEVDKKAERDVFVNPDEINKSKDYYYKIVRTDPSYIHISGPATLVERVASAEFTLDYAKLTRSQYITFTPKLLDEDGAEVEGPFIKSTSSVTVTLEIYPKKTLPVSTDRYDLVPGELPNGYSIDDVTVSPETIDVAAEQELLDTLTEVQLKPVDVTRATQSFNRNTGVNKVDGVVNYSTESVNVKVDISEDYRDKTFRDRPIKLVGLDESKFRVTWSNPTVDVTINALYTVANKITKDDLRITVDLSRITEPGMYPLPVLVRVDDYPELGPTPEPQVVNVTVTAIE